MHLLRAHHDRAEDLGVTIDQQRRWNIAADCEINDDLADLPLPFGGVNPVALGLLAGDLAEVYYHALASVRALPGTWCEGGSGTDGLRREWEVLDTSSGVGAGEDDLIRQQVAMEVRRALNAGAHVPESMMRWAEAFLNPRIDWRRRLAGMVRGVLGVTSGAVDYRYGRPSRRNGSPVAAGVILPSLVAPVPRVAVVVDTSGSMDRAALERVMGELKGILRAAGVSGRATTVLSCDTTVRATQDVFGPASIRLDGGGGTDLGIGLEAVSRLRPPVDVCVVLTDGLTKWPAHKPGRFRTVIGIIGSATWATPPWAEVCEIGL